MKYLFLILIAFFSISINYAQEATKETVRQGKVYPEPSVYNLMDWAYKSNTEWESKMKKYYQFKRSISDRGGIAYSSSEKDITYLIEKLPGNEIDIFIGYHDGKSFFNDLANELEQYYVKTHDNGLVEYGINVEGNLIRFVVSRNSTMDAINVKIFKKP